MKRHEVFRKLFHLTGLVFHPLTVLLYDWKDILWGTLLLTVTLVEVLRVRGKLPFLNRLFSPLMRTEEFKRPSGTLYFLWGVGGSFVLFPLSNALLALWVLCVSDTLAALVGQLFGRLKLGRKTLEGAVAFFSSSVIILKVFGYPLSPLNLVIVLSWTLLELTPRANDNLTLPLWVALSSKVLDV